VEKLKLTGRNSEGAGERERASKAGKMK
jgi:hypothetical protein